MPKSTSSPRRWSRRAEELSLPQAGQLHRQRKRETAEDQNDGSVIVDHSQKKDKADGAKVTMSFVVPKKVVEAGIPEPTDPDVKLSVIEGGKYAVTSFKNSNSEKARQEAITELRAWIKRRDTKRRGTPAFAFYNPP